MHSANKTNYVWLVLLVLTGALNVPGVAILAIAYHSRVQNDEFFAKRDKYQQDGSLYNARVTERTIDGPYVILTLQMDNSADVDHRVTGKEARGVLVQSTIQLWELEGTYFAGIEQPPTPESAPASMLKLGVALLAMGIPVGTFFLREHWLRGPGLLDAPDRW